MLGGVETVQRRRKLLARFYLCLEPLLLVDDLWTEDGVLARHASSKCAVQLGAQRKLLHVVRLLVCECVSLLDEALVFEAVKAGVPCLDVLGFGVAGCGRGVGEVRGRDRGCECRCGAVCGEAGRGAVARRLRFLLVRRRVVLLRHGCGGLCGKRMNWCVCVCVCVCVCKVRELGVGLRGQRKEAKEYVEADMGVRGRGLRPRRAGEG